MSSSERFHVAMTFAILVLWIVICTLAIENLYSKVEAIEHENGCRVEGFGPLNPGPSVCVPFTPTPRP